MVKQSFYRRGGRSRSLEPPFKMVRRQPWMKIMILSSADLIYTVLSAIYDTMGIMKNISGQLTAHFNADTQTNAITKEEVSSGHFDI